MTQLDRWNCQEMEPLWLSSPAQPLKSQWQLLAGTWGWCLSHTGSSFTEMEWTKPWTPMCFH